MILATTKSATGLAQRLSERARQRAEAHAAQRLLARRNDPRRWRLSALLWPGFRQEN